MALTRRAKLGAALGATTVLALIGGIAVIALVLIMIRPDPNCVVAEEGLVHRSQNARPEPDQPWDVEIGDRYGSHSGCVPGDDISPQN